MRVTLGLLALAAASLLVFREPTYDPTAWAIWGRQIAHGTLDTVAGPSWKPLPVLFTTPFSLLGDTAALKAWLIVARVGGLASLLLAYRVASRLAGRREAGVVAALALLLASEFCFNWLRGNSEGLLVAASLLAVDRHLAGRPGPAFAWGVVAALLRPDVWPLLAVYGAWLVHRQRDGRTAGLVAGAGAVVVALWFVPEYLGSGDLLRGASRAREPVEGSPGEAANPFLATFSNSAQALSYGVYAGAVLSLAAARRPRRNAADRDWGTASGTPGAVAAVAAAAALLMVIVALLAQTGFTGSLRYVALPMALLCVLCGVGWVWLAGRLRPLLLVAAALAAAPGVVVSVDRLVGNLERTRTLDRRFAALPGFIERVGGREAVLRCGQVFTRPFETQVVAYRLRLHGREVGLRPRAPGSVLTAIPGKPRASRRFAVKARSTEWTLRATC